ncbi:MAG: anti-sigma factor antagonist [Anaerolineae bacterium]|nr:anti-sigma factor antagonist [Anaerolineae bacterium]
MEVALNATARCWTLSTGTALRATIPGTPRGVPEKSQTRWRRKMEIRVEAMKRCDLVSLSGMIDSANAQDLEEKLLDLIEGGQKNLVLSMGEVTFISSPGLKALLAAQIRARKKVPPGEVVISEIAPNLKEVLELVGLHHLFRFYDQDVEAVGSF